MFSKNDLFSFYICKNNLFCNLLVILAPQHSCHRFKIVELSACKSCKSVRTNVQRIKESKNQEIPIVYDGKC